MDKKFVTKILSELYIDFSLAQDPNWYPEERTFETSKENIRKLSKLLEVEDDVLFEINEVLDKTKSS